MNVVAIIPARGGSRRIPRKNIRPFHGKPILAYSIETARASRLFDRIFVSTEDSLVQVVAKTHGARIHVRPRRLADDITGTQAVMKDAMQWLATCGDGSMPEFACCIYATAPLLNVSSLMAGLEQLRAGGVKYVHAVDRRGFDVGQFYWGRPESFVEDVPLEGNSGYVVMPPERCCDINTEDDWRRAEQMYIALNRKVAA